MPSLQSLDTLYVNACITYASLSAGYFLLSRRDALSYRSAPWRRALFGLIAGLVSLHLADNKFYLTHENYYSFEFVPILLATFTAGWLAGILALLLNIISTGGAVLDNLLICLMLAPVLLARVWRRNTLSTFVIVITLLALFRLSLAFPLLEGRRAWFEALLYQFIAYLCLLICYQALSMMHRHIGAYFSARDSARYDALTRLHNRRSLNKFLDKLESAGASCCLAMLDIDNFKRLNDVHGHLAGDTVLRDIAALLRQEGHETDFIARYGGEEFTLVFSGGDIYAGVRRCEQLRQQIAAAPFLLPDGNTIAITASFGITSHSGQGTIMAALKRADEALYRAKKSGKNRVVRG